MYIRAASKEEILSILCESQIASKLARPVLECLGEENSYIIIIYDQYRMLASVQRTNTKGTYEVHIACPRDSIRASRLLAYIGMKWIIADPNIKAKVLITTAPLGKISNFLKKLKFKQLELLPNGLASFRLEL